MSKVLVSDTSLSAIATAIRAKNGESTLYKPGEMATAIRAIPTGGSAVLEPLSVTENGTYAPQAGVDGFSSVVVNVSGGGGDDPFALTNYIESSGTQWINTGHACTDNTKVEMVANINSTNARYASLFGARDGNYSTARKLFLAYRDSSSMDFYVGTGGKKASVSTALYFGSKTKYTLSKTAYSAQMADGVTFVGGKITGGAVDDTNAMYLLTFNEAGSDGGAESYCSAKLYRFRIFEGNTLALELLPHQENGVACLKDTVSGNLFYNAGTGDFTFGTDT